MLFLMMTTLGLQAPPDTVRLTADVRDAEPRPVVMELRLGRLDGEVEGFGYVTEATVAPNGNLFVVDEQVPVIRMFNDEGEYLGDLGRFGEGPGEYRSVRGVAISPAGEVVVWDFNSQRISWYDPDGTFLRSSRTQVNSLVGAGPGLVVDHEGRSLLRTGGSRTLPGGGREAVMKWARYDRTGAPGDTLIPPLREVSGHLPYFKIETVSVPLSAGGFLTGRNDEYRLVWPSRGGGVTELSVMYESVPVKRAERRQIEDFSSCWQEGMAVEAGPVPRSKPAWKALTVDADHRIWVQRYAEAEHTPGVGDRGRCPGIEWTEPAEFDVFSASGSYLGLVRFPSTASIAHASGSRVWTRQTGSFGEHYLVRYRVDLPGGAGTGGTRDRASPSAPQTWRLVGGALRDGRRGTGEAIRDGSGEACRAADRDRAGELTAATRLGARKGVAS